MGLPDHRMPVTRPADGPPPLPNHPAHAQWDGGLRPVLIAIAVILVGVVLAYRFAVPALANAAARYVPAAAVEAMGKLTLAALESRSQESAVSAARRDAVVRRFASLRLPPDIAASAYDIVFRRSDVIGANALALPSGTILVTDGLVQLASQDEEILAVLAHEAGHVQHRHGLRLLFQSSFARAGLSWLLGDVSALAAQVSGTVLDARYSRDFEREADRFAIALLDENGISREYFARILRRLEEEAARRGMGGGGSLLAYLSSHPVTDERIQAIQTGSAP